ncbi:TonB-dependent copper receptor [Comamonas denitrificans]|uniref:TonB-dependent copper receptor n=1 Tax=Comamonas denitrificans TaxID=117506 RepID=UPI003605F61F
MKLRSFPKNTPLALACTALFTPLVYGQDSAPTTTLDEVVVTAIHDQSAVQVVTDPKIPRQPVPASDAADYLQTIPGFSAVRSGGTNGDPVFRGQFGSRLPLLTNGMQMLGACPGRMDTPSSYIAPETFDVLTLIKGPQTVLWGPGASAGVVRFERERPDFAAGPVNFTASLLGASAGRNDQNADLAAGNDQFYARISANHSHGQDYKDGDGTSIPSGWNKWNADAALGWTPDADTLVELSAGAGDGWARSAARGMDGTQFRRDSLGLRLQKQNITPWLSKVEAQIYRNEADHLMDNFQRRPLPQGKMAMASNVKRVVTGGRIAATLQPTPALTADIGLDLQRNTHEGRSGMGMSYLNKPWVRDAKFANLGLFSELRWQAAPSTLWVGGLRLDRAQAWDYRNPASTHKRDESALPSGFVRWEQTLASGATTYVGLGHVQRFPDYWELISGKAGNVFATLEPEKTTQLDVGANWKGQNWQFWTSAYVGMVRDFILFDYASNPSKARNIDARTAGFELGGSYKLAPAWTAQATVAYTWGSNRSDGTALPQMPPLEARLGLDYAQGPWTAGALWRLVAAQHRYTQDQGNVVGRDMGASSGFGVLSLHASYRVQRQLKITVGVDNLLDKTYAEHLNLAGNAGFGFPANTRLNEPGRTLWLRADMQF